MIELPLDSSNRYPAASWSRPDAPLLAPGAPEGVSFERQLSKAREQSGASTSAEKPTSRDELRDASTDRARPTEARPDEHAAETSREDTAQADTDPREDQPAEAAETSKEQAEANHQEAAEKKDSEKQETPESAEQSAAAVSAEPISSNRTEEQEAKPVADKRELLVAHRQGEQDRATENSAATEPLADDIPSDKRTANVAAKVSGETLEGKAEDASATATETARSQEGKLNQSGSAADAKQARHTEPPTDESVEQVSAQAVAGETAGSREAAKEQKAVDAAPGAKTPRADTSAPSAESAPIEPGDQRNHTRPNRSAAAPEAAPAVNPSEATQAEMRNELASGNAADAIEAADKPGRESNANSPVEQTARPTSGQAERAGAAAPRTSSGDTLAPSDRVRFVERVARAFHAAGDRGGVIRLRLSPPELGAMRLELVVRDGQMHARMETETHTARHALLDNLPMLRDRLAQQDIRIARFDVDVSDQSGGGAHDRTADQPPPEREGSQWHGAGPRRTASVEAAASNAPTEYHLGDGGRLNIVI